MKDLVWDYVLSVGVDEIDEDHRKLVGLFNTLNHSVADGDTPDYVAALLEELITFTAWHFSHEERLMIVYNYDRYEEHKREHEGLIKSVKKLQDKFRQAEKQLSNDDIEYLSRWLTAHILGNDMKLGFYLIEAM